MAITAILHERRLERWLYAGDFGKIDIPSELPLVAGLKVEVFDLSVCDYRYPGLFRVYGVDQHELAHVFWPHCSGAGRRCKALAASREVRLTGASCDAFQSALSVRP